MGGRPEGKRDSTSGPGAARTFERLAEGEFHHRIARSPGTAVVLFTAPHCGACRRWRQLLPAALGGTVDALYEVDVSEATGVARYFELFHLPTIHLYRDGRFHAELQCPPQDALVRAAARALLDGPAQDEPG
ncbi:MAG: thioredoxin family protein [Thiobacillus sp.]